MSIMNNSLTEIVKIYSQINNTLPSWLQTFVNLFLIVIVVVVYAVFVWKFSKFISHKNIFGFNLNKYNTADHPFVERLVAGGLYFLEYIILLPFIIFFWFAIFTFFLILLVTNFMNLNQVILISAIVVAVIRMASYIPNYGQKVSEEIAKMLPFLILANSLTNPTILLTDLFPRLIQIFGNFSSEINGVSFYIIFIILLEAVLRFFDFIFSLFDLDED